VSEEVKAADAALTALHEAQAECTRLTNENDRLLVNQLQNRKALALLSASRHTRAGQTLSEAVQAILTALEAAQQERDYWRVQAQDTLASLHEQAVELDAARLVVEAVRASVQRETACLPTRKADTLALGRVLDALRDYDAATKARE
jgi:hypothetical protein